MIIFIIIMVVHFFHLDQHVSFYPQPCFSHKPKFHSIIMSFHSNNRSAIRTIHGFLCSIMAIITYSCLKSKTYLEKVPVITNSTLTDTICFISIYALWDINFIISQHLYLTQLIPAKNDLRKSVDGTCWHYGKQS